MGPRLTPTLRGSLGGHETRQICLRAERSKRHGHSFFGAVTDVSAIPGILVVCQTGEDQQLSTIKPERSLEPRAEGFVVGGEGLT